MLDVIMEGNDGVMEEFGPSLSEDLILQTFPFSAVVPAALEARNKLPANKGKACLSQFEQIVNILNEKWRVGIVVNAHLNSLLQLKNLEFAASK